MDLSFLPAVNAGLNAVAIALLLLGLVLIRQKKVQAHQRAMMSAVFVSCLFLVLYVAHKWWKTTTGMDLHTTYNAEGWAKGLYLLILLTHLVLAMTVPVFAGVLLTLGYKRRDDLHRRVATFGWPIWMYVSVTGVVIYFMLYHFNPPPAG